ncbi:hypothetical protein [Eggerthella sinensis]|uniref:hypothetical protein n=1 Tax=Eggerthella sinensis TaxID=242230 RepID=UPI00248E8EA1|nr:hypothetical protein [Eggerthella sinensis]
MLTSANVDFISSFKDSFDGKDGNKVAYQRITFLHETDDKPLTLSADTALDFSKLGRYQPISVTINLYADSKGFLKGKVVSFEG